MHYLICPRSSVTDSEAAISAFINTIHPNFNYIVTITAFSACLFTLFAVLLGLSTKESRRRIVFHLNVIAICLALTTSILAGLSNGKAIIDPFNQVSTRVFIAATASISLSPLLYDSILLTRLFALYPPASTRQATLLKIFAFPFCVKCARVVVIALLLKEEVRAAADTTTEVLLQDQATIWFRNPNIVAVWTLQMADNMYSVSLFLYNLHVRTRPLKSEGGIPSRIRHVFYISIANFVFPLVSNIALLISVITDHSPNSGPGVLLLINYYVTVMGVLCATIWFSRSEWTQACKEPLSNEMLRRKLNLPRAPVGVWMGGDEVIVIGKTLTLDPASLDGEAFTNSKQPATPTNIS
ncbi:hypothetical protein EDC04DRAFT_2895805 [Pisolithus marmoratus]|nr:hypothetical protein EDC04DRAFT_2895805 [Pisolithus marmoratus]